MCTLEEIPPQAGIGAQLGSQAIALFRLDDTVYALDDHEPGTEANVLSRGLLGDSQGEPLVISPLYKQRFRLKDGQSLDNPALYQRCWPVKIEQGQVWVASTPRVHTPGDTAPTA
ncbi:nitrite reductase small subunit NirD [Erwinia sp. MYb535]|uniref:nitrite reductase small subunit NirD n=1 Tax=Erwinia sp. MYb535 TaxID=2745309 RepID=UPI00403FA182